MEICQGLQDYFDVMLGTQLLYKFERPQYSDVSTIVCILFYILLTLRYCNLILIKLLRIYMGLNTF